MKVVSLENAKMDDGATASLDGIPTTVDVHDRVAEAYFGKLGERFMRETQQRIHWICSNVRGQSVLDVGCSQGITAILLGREGKEVTGVDAAQRSIEQAQGYLDQESARVRSGVRFIHGDFLTQEFAPGEFETVIVAEVLEHLLQPEAFIEAAARLLPPDGRLIVTVPFGINDFIDHKRTYYLIEPYRLMSSQFEVIEVAMLGKWLGLVGRRRAANEKAPVAGVLDAELVQRLEASFLQLEREIREEAASARTRLNDANLKYRSATEQIATLKHRIEQEEQTHRQGESTTAKLQQQLSHAEQAREKTLTDLQDANQKYRSATEQIATLKQRLADESQLRQRGETELVQLQARIADATQAREALEHCVANLKIQLALAEREAETLTARLNVAEQRAEAERKERQSQIERLESMVDAQRAARHETELRLARIEVENSNAAAWLDEANLKYRSATEKIVELTKRVQEAEASSSAHKAAVTALEERLEAADSARDLLLEEREAIESKLRGEVGELSRQLEEMAAARDDQQFSLARAHAELEDWAARTAALDDELGTIRAERDNLTERLADANAKYRSSAEQYALLRNELASAYAQKEADTRAIAELERQVRTNEEVIGTINEQLAALRDDRDARQAELARTASELETLSALRRGEQHKNEQLKLQVLQSKKALTDLQAKVEGLRQQKITAENQVAKTRAMLSFQLGYRLLHGFKSWRAFTQLPAQLLELRREIVRRRAARASTATLRPKPQTHKEWSPRNNSGYASALSTVTPAVLSLPDSGLISALKTLRVAAIMDDFTFSSYRPECNLLQLSVSHWHNELEAFNPELLFIESAWRGKDEQWGSKVGHTSAEVVGIVEWCRSRKIPTVFWNKEDPVHFETFLSTAKLFDYVFTTDIDCIHRYKAALGHERVYLLPFACQPEANNPIEKFERKDAFCFAGAYYVRYPERTRDLGNFMTALAEYRPVEIYDRNYGKDDPNYQFPPEYKPFIVGNLPFAEIDKAYKGYRYAINLNSIKQSQSMFARRVYELLGCNTITVSNFSRGVRLLFGDLVITTDSGEEIVRRLQSLGGDDVHVRKFRLAGLRKVMSGHTYQDRLAYVVSKAQGKAPPKLLPGIVVTAYAKNQEQFDSLLASFSRQTYVDRRLVVVLPNGFAPEHSPSDGTVQVLPANAIDDLHLGELTGGTELVAGMVADDYYGPNYLLDLALATRYSSAQAIGKIAHHVWSPGNGLTLAQPGRQYVPATSVAARSAVAKSDLVAALPLREWVTTLYTRQLETADALSVDEFNYCKNGGAANFDAMHIKAVDDLPGLDHGIGAEELVARAERIAPEEAAPDQAPVLTGDQLATYFKPPGNKGYTLTVSGTAWEAESTLADGKHEYLYAATDLRPSEFKCESSARFFLDVTPGLNLQFVMLFLDAQKQRISHVVKMANRNQEAAIPAGTEWIRLGLRVYGGGSARINGLVLGHRPLRPAEVLGRAEHLVLTNHYPSYDDLYRNGFVHSRVKAYAERGVRVDVFRLRTDEALSYHEFQNVDVITGSQEALHKLLAGGHYKSVLVHFLDESMWAVLQHHIERTKVFVWVHGAEIQPWYRRDNFENEQQRTVAKAQSDARLRFWRELLTDIPENLKLIFVSSYLAKVTMEDLGFPLPESRYTIIHNPIDTNFFAYSEKTPEQRKRILSIRPYASRTYANDLSVKAILKLSKRPYFDELQFRMIGDGKLFDEILEPIRKFDNVIIDRRFLEHSEIVSLHRNYGIFLCPSRMDTQGVSRDEAMSSGLVPVTNAVGAIPEFVDDSCGFLADAEDAEALANGIETLYHNPDKFSEMSVAAAQRVRNQSSKMNVIAVELELIDRASKETLICSESA